MSAGAQITKAEIDAAAYQISRAVFADLANVQKLKAFLDGYSSANLVTNWGYTSGDADILKSAFTDLGDLALVWNNTTSAYLTGTHNYQAFARQLLGVGLF
jgi:hypothetical protein